MNREEFLEKFKGKVVFLDGATGTNLMKAGMPAGVCPEKWILDHKDVMLDLQKSYVDAGADIIYAPTFTGNRIKLSDYGLDEDIEVINSELVKLAKKAAAEKAKAEKDKQIVGIDDGQRTRHQGSILDSVLNIIEFNSSKDRNNGN